MEGTGGGRPDLARNIDGLPLEGLGHQGCQNHLPQNLGEFTGFASNRALVREGAESLDRTVLP